MQSNILASITAASLIVSVQSANAQVVNPGNIRRIQVQSAREAHPQAKACFNEPNVKLIGGGALVDPVEPGNLLTGSFPEGKCWVALSKDHEASSPATVTAFAIGLFDPKNEYQVTIKEKTSNQTAHPTVVVDLPSGFVLTGGGGRTNFTGAGSLLTASFPQSQTRWEVRAKDHDISDPATVTAFIIGIRREGGNPQSLIEAATSATAAHPTTDARLPDGFFLTGGGARANWADPEPGSLLTASFPIATSSIETIDGWRARSKDHFHPNPVTITAFAIGIR